jgi:SET domain-containing protein
MPPADAQAFLEIRPTAHKGRGVFATRPIRAGARILALEGWQARTDELDEDWWALQIGPDLWLCSAGESLDDYINHSCAPNAGFTIGEPVLYALRDIAAGEEIAWDYSTSMAEKGWTLECRCEAPSCRGTVRSWPELSDQERAGLRPIALAYLRAM